MIVTVSHKCAINAQAQSLKMMEDRRADMPVPSRERPQTGYTAQERMEEADEKACEDVLVRWMDALNAYDAAGMDALMRFPHVRVAVGDVVVYAAPGSNPMDLFERLRKQDRWHHSAWTGIRLVQSSPTKAHYAVQYRRYREDGSAIGVYDSLYVFTKQGDEWKIQCRSSFGP